MVICKAAAKINIKKRDGTVLPNNLAYKVLHTIKGVHDLSWVTAYDLKNVGVGQVPLPVLSGTLV